MSRFKDISGQQFGQWTVIRPLHTDASRRKVWLCRCSCGAEHEVVSTHLLKGSSTKCKSCAGRLSVRPDYTHKAGQTFGRYFSSIKRRKRYHPSLTIEYIYDLYLAQNKKCALTKLSIPVGVASLDRIDSNKDYVPENVQWLHKDVNLMKHTLSQQRLIKLSKLIAETNMVEMGGIEPPSREV